MSTFSNLTYCTHIAIAVSASLPSTPNIKPVEIWLIVNLAYPFFIVIVATLQKVITLQQQLSCIIEAFRKSWQRKNLAWSHSRGRAQGGVYGCSCSNNPQKLFCLHFILVSRLFIGFTFCIFFVMDKRNKIAWHGLNFIWFWIDIILHER